MASRTAVAADIGWVLAPNPGPMTLDGTNTWLLGEPHAGPVVVVDPGPADAGHLDALAAAAAAGVAAVWLTHWHLDHSEAAAPFAERFGCPLLAGADLVAGGAVDVGGTRLMPYATPGHTADSVSVLITPATPGSLGSSGPGDSGGSFLLTGDMVLGRGTTVIMHPDGDLADYFASLELMLRLVADADVRAILPGHGPLVTDPYGWLTYYRAHRRERLDQVRAALAAGVPAEPAAVVAVVYADVDASVRPAAERSVAAQLSYLEASARG